MTGISSAQKVSRVKSISRTWEFMSTNWDDVTVALPHHLHPGSLFLMMKTNSSTGCWYLHITEIMSLGCFETRNRLLSWFACPSMTCCMSKYDVQVFKFEPRYSLPPSLISQVQVLPYYTQYICFCKYNFIYDSMIQDSKWGMYTL